MPTCGYIKVQPDGMKQKAAKSTQKWDTVSKRMIVIPPRNVLSNLIISRLGETSTVYVTWNQTAAMKNAKLQFYRTDILTNITYKIGSEVTIYNYTQSYTADVDFQNGNSHFCTLTEDCSDLITSNKIVTPPTPVFSLISLEYYQSDGIIRNFVRWNCVTPSSVTIQEGSYSEYTNPDTGEVSIIFNIDQNIVVASGITELLVSEVLGVLLRIGRLINNTTGQVIEFSFLSTDPNDVPEPGGGI